MTLAPRVHDMGGLPAGPVDQEEHAPEVWEKTVDVLVRLLSKHKIMSVDELRRGIEDLGPGVYEDLTYYERWIASVTNNLIAKGVITIEELSRTMEQVEAEWNSR